MRSLLIRSLLLFALVLWLPIGVRPPAVHASPSGTWHVLGAANALPTLYRPMGLAVDAGGNVYVADSGNFRVVEIGPRGQLLAHFGEAVLRPGPGTPVLPNGQEAIGPRSLAVGSNGAIYVADSGNRYIRVFSAQHHLVCNWPISISGATVLQMAVAVGGRGNVIVAIAVQIRCSVPLGPHYCATYYVVQKRSPAGALLGQFHSPIGPSGESMSPPIIDQIAAAVDSQGNIYVTRSGVTACYSHCSRFHFLVEHNPAGKVLAQWGEEAFLNVSGNWSALAIDGRGNVFLADDFNRRIDKRLPVGKVLARWTLGSLFPKLVTGPSGVAVDRAGAIYVSDPGYGRILKLSATGKVVAQWGAGGSEAGRFWSPGSVALDSRGRLWVDDATNGRVQMLGSDGRFHVQFTVAHAGRAMAIDRQGNIFIGQLVGRVVYISKFSPSGKLLAHVVSLPTGVLALGIRRLPTGLAIAPNGDIFVAGDFLFRSPKNPGGPDGESILRLDSSGRQLGIFRVSAESTGSGIAVDAQENSYIAYGWPSPRFEKRSRNGALLATWGVSKPVFPSPSPTGITLDSAGNIYVANSSQNVIIKFGPDGRTLGTWGVRGSYPGQFHHPGGIAIDPRGTIYVDDTDNHRIQMLVR